MYAIQAGSKFVNTKSLFSGGSDVYNVVISESPKFYKSRVMAEKDLKSINEWLDLRIASAEKTIAGNTAAIAKANKDIARLQAKLEGLLDLPYREVEKKVEQTRRAIVRAGSDASSFGATLRSYKQDLARYERIRKASPSVVLLQQTVEAL